MTRRKAVTRGKGKGDVGKERNRRRIGKVEGWLRRKGKGKGEGVHAVDKAGMSKGKGGAGA